MPFSRERFADHTGVHRTHYGDIEHSEQNPALWSLRRIALGLNMALPDLLAEAETLDLDRAARESPVPLRRGRPPGRRSC